MLERSAKSTDSRASANVRLLARSFWGAAFGNVHGDHVETYLRLMSEESASSTNPRPEQLKKALVSETTEALRKSDQTVDDLLVIPWSSRRIKPTRLAAHLISFANEQGKTVAVEFFPVEKVQTFLEAVKNQHAETNEKLTVVDQYAIALSQTDNNPVAAALLATSAYRAVARSWDTQVSQKLKFPVTSEKGLSMMALAQSTADFERKNQKEPRDPLGDTYHFWTQFSAGMIYTLLEKDHPIQARVYEKVFYNGPALQSGGRRLTHQPLVAGVHEEVDRQGLALGKSMGKIIRQTV